MKNRFTAMAVAAVGIVVVVGMVRAQNTAPGAPASPRAGGISGAAIGGTDAQVVRGEASAATFLRGAVVKVDGATLTVKVTKGGESKEVAVATDDKTVVNIQGKVAKLADLQAGQRVVVSPAEGTAKTVEVLVTPPPKAAATK